MSTDVHVFMARATAEPESRVTPKGTQVASFSLALSRKNGLGEQETIYPNFVTYGATAEAVVDKVHKGSKVVVTKSLLNIRKYTGQDGVPRTTSEFVITSPSDFYVEWTPEQVEQTTQAPQATAPRKGFQAPTRKAVAQPTQLEDDLEEYIG